MTARKELFEDIALAILDTLKTHAIDFLINGLFVRPASKAIAATITPPRTGVARLLSARTLSTIAPDGAVLDGPAGIGYAKFALRKGLPGPGQKRMAVENDPHLIDDFDGEIKEGYGKGTKKLVYTGNAVIKADNRKWIGKVNIHEHKAERAGLHYDFVAEGIAPRTAQFEVNIPSGVYKGRYAFVSTSKLAGDKRLVLQMKDRGVVVPKPQFNLKDVTFLKELESNSPLSTNDIIVEWKPDGSLANVLIEDNRAIFRSHRDSGETYYDRLPALESLSNHSALASCRLLFPGPDLDGTLIRGELFHPEGAARVGGILNSAPDKAIAYQQENGDVTFYAWDILKLKGRDISGLPYQERRRTLEHTIEDVQRFNSNWKVVPYVDKDFVGFYNRIISDSRGLPWSEGVVIKSGSDPSGNPWYKVKFRDTVDVRVDELLEGAGKREGKVGRMVVTTDSGGTGEVGSFKATDAQLKWMWDNRDILKGQVAEIHAQEITKAGAPRAGVFIRWHPSKSEHALLMYSLDDRETMYKLKSAAGWRRK
jgi:hypothetical protein